MTRNAMNRRDFLAGSAALALAPALAGAKPTPKRPFRFAFLTDTHLKDAPTVRAVGRALAGLRKEAPDVRLLLHGGDLLNAADARPLDESRALIAAWKEMTRGYETRHVLGNHDLAALATPEAPGYGKALFEREIGPLRRSFTAGGLTFLLFDTVRIEGGGFRGAVDDATLAWLAAELAKTPNEAPIVTMGHVPLLTVMPLYDAGATVAPSDKLVVANGKAVVDLLRTRRVVAHLQGHTHVGEVCDDLSTKWLTGGAVCGDWWKGDRFGRYAPGYGLCAWDGETFAWTYRPYPWSPLA